MMGDCRSSSSMSMERHVRFTEQLTYPSSSQRILRMFCDSTFLFARFSPICTDVPSIEISDENIVVNGLISPDIFPARVQSFLNGPLPYTFTETWTRSEHSVSATPTSGEHRTESDAHCVAQADTTLIFVNIPVRLHAHSTLSESHNGCRRELNGTVDVTIPFMGSRIEQEILAHANDVISAELTVCATWLTADSASHE